MKVAISVPEPVFSAAERLAAHMGKSRSQLYSEAIARYIETNQASMVTEQLNAVYAQHSAKLDPTLQAAQFQVLDCEAW
jgi:metal-responsive CopG/Arc/MetJ family transcriptional regulator